jgi:predicted DNA-binding protein
MVKTRPIRIDEDLDKHLKRISDRLSKEKGYYIPPGRIIKERFKNEY